MVPPSRVGVDSNRSRRHATRLKGALRHATAIPVLNARDSRVGVGPERPVEASRLQGRTGKTGLDELREKSGGVGRPIGRREPPAIGRRGRHHESTTIATREPPASTTGCGAATAAVSPKLPGGTESSTTSPDRDERPGIGDGAGPESMQPGTPTGARST